MMSLRPGWRLGPGVGYPRLVTQCHGHHCSSADRRVALKFKMVRVPGRTVPKATLACHLHDGHFKFSKAAGASAGQG